ncbi:hypothetical protein, partial [Nodularia spumigena]|uniref:hypothetical protein n=1 Tax=Nodularia spumigena TaxID=70799 RepID=UPI0023310C58
RTYAHSTFSWRSWRLKPWGHTLREGGMGFAHATRTINQDFWQLLRKSCNYIKGIYLLGDERC